MVRHSFKKLEILVISSPILRKMHENDNTMFLSKKSSHAKKVLVIYF